MKKKETFQIFVTSKFSFLSKLCWSLVWTWPMWTQTFPFAKGQQLESDPRVKVSLVWGVTLWLEPVGLSVGGSPSQGAGCMSWKHLEQAPVWVRAAVGAQVTAHGSGTTCRGDNLLCVLQTTCVESVTASFNKHISVLCREVFSYSLGKLKTRERYFSWIIWGAYLHSVFTII